MTAETWATLSNNLLYSAIAIYTLAMIAFAAELAYGRTARTPSAVPATVGGAGRTDDDTADFDTTTGPATPDLAATRRGPEPGSFADKAGRAGMSLLWLGFGLQLVSVIARGVAAGRWPLGNMFEFAVGGTLAAVGVFLFLSTRRDVRWAGLFIALPAVLILGLAATVLYVEAAELVPALKSSWLVVHVSMATLCAGLFTVGAIASALYLLQARWERAGATHALARRLPDSATLDRLAYRTFAFAFPLWTFAVISGAIWAESAWGRYWGWDPKETWAFITWLIYAGYLHARATAGWKANRAAWIGLIGFASFVFNFVGVNIWIPGLHSYAGL